MADDTRGALARLLADRDCGPLLRALALRGSVTLPSGATTSPHLCLTSTGAWLVGVQGDEGFVRDVLDAHPLRYEARLLADRLVLGTEVYSIPLAKSTDARVILGAGKVRREHAEGAVLGEPRAPRGPWVDATTPVEQAWLDAALDPDDPILAWLHTSTITRFEESIEPACEAGFRLLLTRDRVALVAVSAVGDVRVTPLPDQPLQIVEGRGATVQVGDQAWQPVGNTVEFLRVAPLPGAVGADRLRLAAARARQSGQEGELLADHLLTRLLPIDAPIDKLISASRARPAREAEVLRAVDDLPRTDDGNAALARWLTDWGPPVELAQATLRHLMEQAESPEAAAWSLPMHRALRDRLLAETTDRFAEAEADIALAEHLLYAGLRDEARGVLLSRRQALPDEDLAAVVPPEDADLTSYEGGAPAHVRLLELLAATGPGDQRDPSALAALARQQPLVLRRLTELAEAASGSLESRAAAARAALEPGGLTAAGPSVLPTYRSLPAELVEVVQHPAARSGGVLGRVQSAVAKVTPPDFGVLRSYCERVTLQRHPDLQRALTDACVLFGMPVVDAYLSQGDRRVGLRSHEQPEPFLVVGGAHLDPNSGLALSQAELRAAIGGEVAHLRFGHSRITSSDIWAGLMDKGATALTTTAAVLPFLRFLPVDLLGRDKTWRVVQTVVPQRWLRAVYGVDDATALAKLVPSDLGRLGNAGAAAVDTAEGSLTAFQSAARRILPARPQPVVENVGLDNIRLVAAHRVMQLTADRAGLLLSRDLGASIRAMFLTHTRLANELGVAESQGLPACLSRRTADDRLVLPDLAVRVAALVSFWLSDDYARLTDAALTLSDQPASDEGPTA